MHGPGVAQPQLPESITALGIPSHVGQSLPLYLYPSLYPPPPVPLFPLSTLFLLQ